AAGQCRSGGRGACRSRRHQGRAVQGCRGPVPERDAGPPHPPHRRAGQSRLPERRRGRPGPRAGARQPRPGLRQVIPVPGRGRFGMKPLLLPDFCASRAVLMVLVVVAAAALLLTLAVPGPGPRFWADLARRMLFLLWVGLAGAAVLCALRPRIPAPGALAGAILVLGIVVIVVAGVSEAAWFILNSRAFNPGALLGTP